MDSLQDILGKKNFTQPTEMTAIKAYISRTYQSKCLIKLDRDTLIISVPSSGLAATLQLEKNQLIEKCNLGKKKIVIKNSRY